MLFLPIQIHVYSVLYGLHMLIVDYSFLFVWCAPYILSVYRCQIVLHISCYMWYILCCIFHSDYLVCLFYGKLFKYCIGCSVGYLYICVFKYVGNFLYHGAEVSNWCPLLFLSCVSVLIFFSFSFSSLPCLWGNCYLLPYFLVFPPLFSFLLYLWVTYLTCLCGTCMLTSFILGGDWNGNLLVCLFLLVFYECQWTCVFFCLFLSLKIGSFPLFLCSILFASVYLFYWFY